MKILKLNDHGDGVNLFQKKADFLAKTAIVSLYFLFPISVAGANIAMVAVLVFGLLAGQYQSRWSYLRRNPLVWISVGLYAWMIVGIAYSPAVSGDIAQHLGKYFKLIFLVFAAGFLADAVWRYRCWVAFVAAMLFTLASTYANILVDLPWSGTHRQGWGVDHTVFKDYISQGIMMAMLVLIALSQTLNSKLQPLMRYTWGGVALLAAISITHLSAGRTGYMALAAVLGAFALFAIKGRSRWLLVVFTLAAAITVFLTSPGLQSRVVQAVEEARGSNDQDFTSIGQRLYFAEKTWALIQEKPLLGWGTGAYHEQYCKVASSPEWCNAGKFHPHNQFLFVWMENGLLGLFILSALVLLPLWAVRAGHGPKAVIGAGFSGIFLVDCITHGALWLSTESHFFTLMIVLVVLLIYDEEELNLSYHH